MCCAFCLPAESRVAWVGCRRDMEAKVSFRLSEFQLYLHAFHKVYLYKTHNKHCKKKAELSL